MYAEEQQCEILERVRRDGKVSVEALGVSVPTIRADLGTLEARRLLRNVHASRRATLGPLATDFLGQLQVDRSFIGVNGVRAESGWTVVDFDAAQVKRAMMARAREVVVVADGSKLGAAAFASICPLSSAHILVTDAPPENSLAEALASAGVETLIAV